jgi:hypothetical protein
MVCGLLGIEPIKIPGLPNPFPPQKVLWQELSMNPIYAALDWANFWKSERALECISAALWLICALLLLVDPVVWCFVLAAIILAITRLLMIFTGINSMVASNVVEDSANPGYIKVVSSIYTMEQLMRWLELVEADEPLLGELVTDIQQLEGIVTDPNALVFAQKIGDEMQLVIRNQYPLTNRFYNTGALKQGFETLLETVNPSTGLTYTQPQILTNLNNCYLAELQLLQVAAATVGDTTRAGAIGLLITEMQYIWSHTSP